MNVGVPPDGAYVTVPSAATVKVQAGPSAGHDQTTLPCDSEAPARTVIEPADNPCTGGIPNAAVGTLGVIALPPFAGCAVGELPPPPQEARMTASRTFPAIGRREEGIMLGCSMRQFSC